MYPLRLKPKLDHRLWGGQRLARWVGLPEPLPDDLAEIWLVYAKNAILNGDLAGKTLGEAAEALGESLLGTQSLPRYGHDFPQLAKFIDANDKLSIQVHPDDAYAHTVEAHTGFHGKTEAWYILHAEPGANLIYGLSRPSNREEFARAVEEGWLEELMNYLPVQAGDVVFVPAGTLHAINEGIVLFEIQQKSDLTYRVYDYNRRGPDGKLRELHLAKELDVIRYEPPAQEKIPPLNLGPGRDLLVACPFFALERHRYEAPVQLSTRPTSFETWTVIDGAATVAGEKLALGQSLVLPAALGDYTIEPAGNVTLLRTIYPDLQTDFIAPLRQLGYSEDRIFQTVKMPDYG
jgi:mannose-6-phosphate isomerase